MPKAERGALDTHVTTDIHVVIPSLSQTEAQPYSSKDIAVLTHVTELGDDSVLLATVATVATGAGAPCGLGPHGR